MLKNGNVLLSKRVCFLCGRPSAAWLLSKKQKPYWKCSSCYSTFFCNTNVSLEAFLEIELSVLHSEEKLREAMKRSAFDVLQPQTNFMDKMKERISEPIKSSNL